MRSFTQYYFGTFVHPRRTMAELVGDARRVRLGTAAFSIAVVGYTLVYVFLVFGHGRPTVFTPWLAIPAEVYYRWDRFLLAPSMVMSWLLAAAVAQLLSRAFGGAGSFEDTLSALGFGIGVASWTLMLHDLVTAFLGAVGVIDQRAYEDAMNAPTIWRTLLWIQMGLYLAAFVALFSIGIAATQRIRRGPALFVGTTAFVVYQLVFVIFNR